MKRGKIEIKNADDLNCIIIDILDELIDSFSIDGGEIRLCTVNDRIEYGADEFIEWVFTEKGRYLYDKAQERFKKVALKYFDESEIYFQSSRVHEY